MSRNKLSIDFKNFEEYAEKLDKLGGDLRGAVEQALRESAELITQQINADMPKHRRTGRTQRSILNDSVEWNGSIAEIKVGFDISNGGFPSIFLMYGTPRMAKDQKLYNDVYGVATQRRVKEIQEKIFANAIKQIMGG